MIRFSLLSLGFILGIQLFAINPDSGNQNSPTFSGKKRKVFSVMKDAVDEWERRENFVSSWGIERNSSSKIYSTPSINRKTSELLKHSDDLAEATLDDEIENRKNKKESSDSLQRLKSSVNPGASLNFNDRSDITIGVKGNMFKQSATVYINNPIINTSFNDNLNNQWKITSSKEVKSLALVNSVSYNRKNSWEFITTKNLMENVELQLSSRNHHRPVPLVDEADKGVALFYRKLF